MAKNKRNEFKIQEIRKKWQTKEGINQYKIKIKGYILYVAETISLIFISQSLLQTFLLFSGFFNYLLFALSQNSPCPSGSLSLITCCPQIGLVQLWLSGSYTLSESQHWASSYVAQELRIVSGALHFDGLNFSMISRTHPKHSGL